MSYKFFIGAKLKRLRNVHGLTQAKMSKEIDISTSYLNLLESNQRPLSLTVLMKIHERFSIDISEFTKDDSFELVNDLRHVFSDPMNMDTPMTKREISDFAQSFPNAAVALVSLFSRFEKIHEQLSLKNFNEESESSMHSPFDTVASSFLRSSKGFEKIQAQAVKFRENLFEHGEATYGKSDKSLGNVIPNILPQLVYYADTQLGIRIRIIPSSVLGNSASLYDPHKAEILINKKETNLGRQFHLLVELALMTHRKLFDELAESFGITELQKIAAFRIALAGFFAGVVLVPKTPFSNWGGSNGEQNSARFSEMSYYFSAGFAALGNSSV